jgi:acetylornithine/N-succinyldiaminopimelate aminotransferase
MDKSSKILPIHNRLDVGFSHGKGLYLYDLDNKKYLDFSSGVAVNIFGHCYPELVEILQNQAEKLWHVSNLYQIPELEKFATNITNNSFADYAFVCNSGSEAIECGIKMSRKYFHHKKKFSKKEFITFEGAFHGRTIAAISASNNKKHIEGFDPLLPGFHSAKFNDIKSVENIINKIGNENIASILIEPIQGEQGIIVADKKFMKNLHILAKNNDILLFLDEVQCGFARTGYLYAYQYYDTPPDILASAKAMGGGFPVGACLATKEVAVAMGIGSHGTTYGGNPIATRIANFILNKILSDNFLENVQEKGVVLMKKLLDLQKKFPNIIEDVRGVGLMCGIQINQNYNANDLVNKLKDNYLLTVPAGNNVIRILPALIVEDYHIDEFYKIMVEVLQNIN